MRLRRCSLINTMLLNRELVVAQSGKYMLIEIKMGTILTEQVITTDW